MYRHGTLSAGIVSSSRPLQQASLHIYLSYICSQIQTLHLTSDKVQLQHTYTTICVHKYTIGKHVWGWEGRKGGLVSLCVGKKGGVWKGDSVWGGEKKHILNQIKALYK